MDTDELKTLIVQLAAVVDRLDQRSESAVQRVEQAGASLDQRAQWLGSSAGSFTKEVSQALQQQSGEIVGRGLSGSVEHFNTQIAASARTASAAAQTLEKVRQALNRERRTWLWLGCGALLVGSMLAVGASVYAVNASRKEVARHRIEESLLRAYNQADVMLCGERLCANVDEKSARFGSSKQYLAVRPRLAR